MLPDIVASQLAWAFGNSTLGQANMTPKSMSARDLKSAGGAGRKLEALPSLHLNRHKENVLQRSERWNGTTASLHTCSRKVTKYSSGDHHTASTGRSAVPFSGESNARKHPFRQGLLPLLLTPTHYNIKDLQRYCQSDTQSKVRGRYAVSPCYMVYPWAKQKAKRHDILPVLGAD